jgi:WD40 repeat protein
VSHAPISVRYALSAQPCAERLTGSGDTTGRIWEAATGEAIAELSGHTSAIIAMTATPTGDRLITGSLDNTARIWSFADVKQLTLLEGHIGAVTLIDVSEDGTKVVTGSFDGTARIWDTATGPPVCP